MAGERETGERKARAPSRPGCRGRLCQGALASDTITALYRRALAATPARVRQRSARVSAGGAGRWSDCNTQWRTNAQRQGSPTLRASPDASQVREAVTPDTPALSSSGSPSFVPKTLSNRCPLITQKMEF